MTTLEQLYQLRAAVNDQIAALERRNGINITTLHAAPAKATNEAVDQIVDQTARRHAVTIEELMSASQRVNVAHARFELCYLLRELGFSYPQVGEIVGRHHTTVMHAVRRYEAGLPQLTAVS